MTEPLKPGSRNGGARDTAAQNTTAVMRTAWAPSQKRSHFAGGIDSFQALILALQMIGAEIYASAYHKAGSLKWFERYRGYGFPVGCNLRDLLIGDDRKL